MVALLPILLVSLDYFAALATTQTKTLPPERGGRAFGLLVVDFISVERLDLHDAMVVIAADPERHRRRRVVDSYRAHIGVGRHQILLGLAGLRVHAHDAVEI